MMMVGAQNSCVDTVRQERDLPQTQEEPIGPFRTLQHLVLQLVLLSGHSLLCLGWQQCHLHCGGDDVDDVDDDEEEIVRASESCCRSAVGSLEQED